MRLWRQKMTRPHILLIVVKEYQKREKNNIIEKRYSKLHKVCNLNGIFRHARNLINRGLSKWSITDTETISEIHTSCFFFYRRSLIAVTFRDNRFSLILSHCLTISSDYEWYFQYFNYQKLSIETQLMSKK